MEHVLQAMTVKVSVTKNFQPKRAGSMRDFLPKSFQQQWEVFKRFYYDEKIFVCMVIIWVATFGSTVCFFFFFLEKRISC